MLNFVLGFVVAYVVLFVLLEIASIRQYKCGFFRYCKKVAKNGKDIKK